MLISVIVPIYNVDQFLRKCLDSIINQTYKNIEIILVNDGSTDQSLAICEVFSKTDSRIKIINKENGGLMSAWISGFNQAKGKYVLFVDSDDWIEHNMVEKLIQPLEKESYDLIICNHVKEFENHKVKVTEKIPSGSWKNSDISNKIYSGLLNNDYVFGRNLNFCRWAKLIKRDIVKQNLKYCNTLISYGEDVNILFPIFFDARSIYILEDFLYHYRQNQTSIMNTYKKNMDEQIKILTDILIKINNSKVGFDFTEQIINNHISMILDLVRNEMKNNVSINIKIQNIVKLNENEITLTSFKNSSLKNLSVFDKIIIFGIRKKSYFILFLILKLYNLKTNKFIKLT